MPVIEYTLFLFIVCLYVAGMTAVALIGDDDWSALLWFVQVAAALAGWWKARADTDPAPLPTCTVVREYRGDA